MRMSELDVEIDLHCRGNEKLRSKMYEDFNAFFNGEKQFGDMSPEAQHAYECFETGQTMDITGEAQALMDLNKSDDDDITMMMCEDEGGING